MRTSASWKSAAFEDGCCPMHSGPLQSSAHRAIVTKNLGGATKIGFKGCIEGRSPVLLNRREVPFESLIVAFPEPALRSRPRVAHSATRARPPSLFPCHFASRRAERDSNTIDQRSERHEFLS